MRWGACLLGVLFTCTAVIAAGPTYVAVGLDEALQPSPVGSMGPFAKADKGVGTVNPHAVVVTVGGADAVKIAVAIDSIKADAAAPDCLRLDFTGEGKFANAPVVPFGKSRQGDDMTVTDFGPKVIQAKIGDRTMPVTIEGRYLKAESNRQISLTATTAIQASCKFGDKTCQVRLVEATGNFNFCDRTETVVQGAVPVHFTTGDTLEVDSGDGKFDKNVQRVLYGQPVLVGDKWYNIKVSEDGSKVSAQACDAQTAHLKVDQPGAAGILVGKKYIQVLSNPRGTLDLPADQYTLTRYEIRPSKPDSQAVFVGAGAAGKPIDLVAGKTVELKFGVPLMAKLDVAVSGRDVRFSLDLADAGGGKVQGVLLDNGKTPAAPKITVTDASGKTVLDTTLAYG